MQTTYLKITRPKEYWYKPTYIKIMGDENSSEIYVFEGNIDFRKDTGDSFEERLAFHNRVVLVSEVIEEVSRAEFDMFYRKQVGILNELV